jgi:hypothetical protein
MVYRRHALCMLHSELYRQYFCTLHSTKCKTLNPKCRKLHLDLTLTLIPNQSYAKMHWSCIEYAYAYSYYAYLGISIQKCSDVHIGMGNSCPDMDEHWLLHDFFLPDMYKDEFSKHWTPWFRFYHTFSNSRTSGLNFWTGFSSMYTLHIPPMLKIMWVQSCMKN